MDNIQERMKSVRKTLEMNQTDFGKRIGLSQGGYGAVETGVRKLTDRTIMQICQEFNISETWLRTGSGEMFVDNSATILSQLAREYGLSSRSSALVESFLDLSDEQREAIVCAVEAAAEKIKSASSADDNADDWKKRELEDYAKELDAQEKGLSADGTISVTEKKA